MAAVLTAVLDRAVGHAKVVTGEVRIGVALPVKLVEGVQRFVEQIVLLAPRGELRCHTGDDGAQPVHRQLGHNTC